MHIEFIKNHGAYSPGDIAGFDPSVAEVLVEKGVAVRKRWNESPAPQVDAGLADSGQATESADKPSRAKRK
uniref:hypothetical protein n=1 Tax=Castellaniella defragrans TaxID=75697 RepID=UPI003340E84E